MAVAATLIIDEIMARMANITTANGYNNNVLKIARGKLEPFVGYDLPAINVWATNLNSTQLSYDHERRELSIMIEIHGHTRDIPFTTVCERLAADVVTAMNRAVLSPAVSDNDSPNLAETVQDLNFEGYSYEVGNGQKPFCGALVRFTVVYHASKNDMTNYE